MHIFKTKSIQYQHMIKSDFITLEFNINIIYFKNEVSKIYEKDAKMFFGRKLINDELRSCIKRGKWNTGSSWTRAFKNEIEQHKRQMPH